MQDSIGCFDRDPPFGTAFFAEFRNIGDFDAKHEGGFGNEYLMGVADEVEVEELIKRLHGQREAKVERMEEEVVGKEAREKLIKWADEKA